MIRSLFKIIVPVLILCFGFVCFASEVVAQAPRTFGYQGFLKQDDTVVSGSFSIAFTLYDALSGGSSVWTETQTVSVTDGFFSVTLGASTSLESVDFSNDYYLEISVAGETLSPRQSVHATPVSLISLGVESRTSAPSSPIDGSLYYDPTGSGALYVYDSSADTWTNVAQVSSGADDLGDHTMTENLQTAGYWISNDGDDEGLYVASTGYVGIGTTSPTTALDILGNIRIGGSNAVSANIQYGELMSTDYGVDRNNIVLRAPDNDPGANIRIEVVDPESHIGFNRGGTTASAVTIQKNPALAYGHINIRSEDMMNGVGSEETRIGHNGTDFEIVNLGSGNVYAYPAGGVFALRASTTSPVFPTSGAGIEFVYDADDAVQETTGRSTILSYDRDASSFESLRLNAYDIRLQSSSVDTLTITNAGNVGIGTTSPGEKLEISGGTIQFDNATYMRWRSSSDVSGAILGVDGSDRIVFGDFSNAYDGIQFRVGNNSDALAILESGNVGIGTTNPSDELHVVGNILAENTGAGSVLIVNRTDGKSANLLAGLNGGAFMFDETGFFQIQSGDSASEILAGVGTGDVRFHIEGSSGYVGIGTTNPGQALDVRGLIAGGSNATAIDGGYYTTLDLSHPNNDSRDAAFFNFNTSGHTFGMQVASVFGTNDTFFQADHSTNDSGYFVMEAFRTNGMIFSTNGASGVGEDRPIIFSPERNEAMRITSTGNVGIGTTSPSSTLHLESSAPYLTFVDTSNAGSAPVGRLTVGADAESKSNFTFWVGADTGSIVSSGNQ